MPLPTANLDQMVSSSASPSAWPPAWEGKDDEELDGSGI